LVEGVSEVASQEDTTPEWRRKNPGAALHKGYFSECSEETQRGLRESRAKMLMAKNEALEAKAKMDAIRAKAAVKSRNVEQLAELNRLRTEAKLKVAMESKFGKDFESGFAETIVENGLEGVCGTPSLSNGSVSPDSSISVAEVKKMERAIQKLTEEVRAVKLENDVLRKKGFEPGVPLLPRTRAAVADELAFAENYARHPYEDDPRYHELKARKERGSILGTESVLDAEIIFNSDNRGVAFYD